MFKKVLFICSIFVLLYSFYYVNNFKNNIINDSLKLDDINVKNAVKLDSSSLDKGNLPKAKKARTLVREESVVDYKMKKTPLSWGPEEKTLVPRLTPEEIKKSKVVAELPMRVGNEDMVMVIVEKDGRFYDASDGVRVYRPIDFPKLFHDYGVSGY